MSYKVQRENRNCQCNKDMIMGQSKANRPTTKTLPIGHKDDYAGVLAALRDLSVEMVL
jgi:hypothetical protein